MVRNTGYNLLLKMEIIILIALIYLHKSMLTLKLQKALMGKILYKVQ